MKVRLQKFIAEAGLSSRRAAERLMTEGRVWVNGQPARELGTQVDPRVDLVMVDGRPVKPRRRLTVALHKPPGFVCSRSPQTARQRLVGELLPAEWHDLYPVGRLDCDSEGLLLMTNDGEFCLRLTHPRYGVTKVYRATVEGKVGPEAVARLRAGVEHEGDTLRARRARVLAANASHSYVELELTEGKQHEVRRMFAVLGFPVERLERLQIGPIRLGELKPGRWRVLTATELEALRQAAPAAPPAPPRGTAGVDRTPARPSTRPRP